MPFHRSSIIVFAIVIATGIAFAASNSARAQVDPGDEQYYADVYGGDTYPDYGYDFAAPYFNADRFSHRPFHGRFHEGFHEGFEGFHGGLHGGGFHGGGFHGGGHGR